MHKDMTLAPEQTHREFFRRMTHPLLSASACRAPLRLGSQQQSCFGMQYVWKRRGVGWGGVGASVGSGSKLLEDVRRTESGSCVAASALRRSLLLSTSTLQTPCWGETAYYLGKGCARSQIHWMLEVPSLYKVGALSSSKLVKTWVNKSAAPR